MFKKVFFIILTLFFGSRASERQVRDAIKEYISKSYSSDCIVEFVGTDSLIANVFVPDGLQPPKGKIGVLCVYLRNIVRKIHEKCAVKVIINPQEVRDFKRFYERFYERTKETPLPGQDNSEVYFSTGTEVAAPVSAGSINLLKRPLEQADDCSLPKRGGLEMNSFRSRYINKYLEYSYGVKGLSASVIDDSRMTLYFSNKDHDFNFVRVVAKILLEEFKFSKVCMIKWIPDSTEKPCELEEVTSSAIDK